MRKFVGLPDKITVDALAHSWPGSATLAQGLPTLAKPDHDWVNRPQSSSLLLYELV